MKFVTGLIVAMAFSLLSVNTAYIEIVFEQPVVVNPPALISAIEGDDYV